EPRYTRAHPARPTSRRHRAVRSSRPAPALAGPLGCTAATQIRRTAAAVARLAAAGRSARGPRSCCPAADREERPRAARRTATGARRATAPGMAGPDGRSGGHGRRLPLGGPRLPKPFGRRHRHRRQPMERPALLRPARRRKMTRPQLRCALYTRKSSDEGLDQTFNSLDAQREACEAFVQSQRSEGWRGLATRYDDGGYSGGSMERPALMKLLADVAAGKI